MALILASASPIRRIMLENAGVDHQAIPAGVDESELKEAIADASELSTRLAEAKAEFVSRDRPADWVIGSDSVVTVGDRAFHKASSLADAAEHLRYFSGRTIALTSAVALAQGGSIDWNHADTARLQVRRLSEDFITEYLAAEWPEVGKCVGAFRMEGRGAQLFERIDGSHFTILGMPLLPLLAALRERGVIAA